MITANMTKKDIEKLCDSESKAIDYFVCDKVKALSRELRRGLGKKVCKCYDYVSSSKTEYKICLTVTRRQYGIRCFAYCNERNEYIITLLQPEEKGKIFTRAITPHFLRRYAERYIHRSDMSINAMLSEFTEWRSNYVLIYYKNDNAVFTTNRGLVFGYADKERHIFIQRTFVGVDMLKPSQLAVYNKLFEIVEDKEERWTSHIGEGVGCSDALFAEYQRREIDLGLLYREYDEYFRKYPWKRR